MARRTTEPEPQSETNFDDVFRAERGYLVGVAARILGDRGEAEDVVQEAFSRLARADRDEIDDVRGWMTVVVRRLSIDRVRSARSRRESTTDADFGAAERVVAAPPAVDPADRITLDDQLQVALGVVLERLTPAERTAYVLHDVFGFPFDAIAEIVGRTPTACRQLASRARHAIRAGGEPTARVVAAPEHREVVDRFIAACAGGDLGALMEVLDPDVVGDATLVGAGPLAHAEGRSGIAEQLLRLFGPPTNATLVPVTVEGQPGIVAYVRDQVRAVIRLRETDARISQIDAWVLRPS